MPSFFKYVTQKKIWKQTELPTVDHEITLKILEFILNSMKKVKSLSFLLSSMCMFPELNGTKS